MKPMLLMRFMEECDPASGLVVCACSVTLSTGKVNSRNGSLLYTKSVSFAYKQMHNHGGNTLAGTRLRHSPPVA